MKRFKAIVEYDGTLYHGWQVQKDLSTVQGELERVLERILGKLTRVYGAGRTDAGVHARGQVAHFDAAWSAPVHALRRACNALLPRDILISEITETDNSFHARHAASAKTYSYTILNRPLRSPFDLRYSWHIPEILDLQSMSEAAAHLLGAHDFAAFGSPTDGTPSTVRELLDARWDRMGAGGMQRFTVRGTGFLRYMVRSLVGTLVLVGRKKAPPSMVIDIMASRDRGRAGPTAPPHGLCLDAVEYGPRVIYSDRATREREADHVRGGIPEDVEGRNTERQGHGGT